MKGLPAEAVALARDVRAVLADATLRQAAGAYAALLVGLLTAALLTTSLTVVALSCALSALLFPAAEYLIHRYVLHPLIYLDTRLAARFWIRAHYAHHNEPSRHEVILASPFAVAAMLASLGLPVLLIEPGVILAWVFAVLVPFLVYEVVHYATHAPLEFESRYLRNRKARHMLHHFHNEQFNYGICTSLIDRLVGTEAARPAAVTRSATVRNLGYDGEIAQLKPLVRIEYERRQSGS